MYDKLLQPDLRILLESQDRDGLREFCEALYPAVIAEILEGMDSVEVWEVLSACSIDLQAEILEFLDLGQQVELVQIIDRKHLSQIIEVMSADDRVDLLERLDSETVESLLPLVAQAERSDIRKLLSVPENSAGSIMTTEYATLTEEMTVREALDQLRKQAPDSETIYYVYVIDDGRRLHGIISLRELILARPSVRLADIMNRDVVSVRIEDDREFAAQELGRFDLIALPVVDSQNRLVGIVTHDDVLDVVQEEASEDAYRQGAVEPLEYGYLIAPLHEIAWKRGIWLVLLLGAAFCTAFVLSIFEGVSQQLHWMVMFLPMVLAGGGNAGSQSATLVIRTLALGNLSGHDVRRLIYREVVIGMFLGLGLMLLGFAAALVFRDMRDAGVVSITLLLVVMFGTFLGGILPLIFKRLGMDPALMSNPLIAALSDMIGVLTFYNLARWLLLA